MASGFRFKRFVVNHDKCAMKVGTDGVLLGAWATGGNRVLDIGTGSGLIALMMAQRFPQTHVTAVDIEPGACIQASENVERSEFKGRIDVVESAIQDYSASLFDSIVCNPPFYEASPASSTYERTLARSSVALPFPDLFRHASRLLLPEGVFSVVVPASHRVAFDAEAAFAGLWPLKACGIRTVGRKPVGRWLLAYGKRPAVAVEECEKCLNNDDMTRSDWYMVLTADFYL